MLRSSRRLNDSVEAKQILAETRHLVMRYLLLCFFFRSLMLIAWMTCVSIGVLFARHFKPLFHDQTCFKEKVWFQVRFSFSCFVTFPCPADQTREFAELVFHYR